MDVPPAMIQRRCVRPPAMISTAAPIPNALPPVTESRAPTIRCHPQMYSGFEPPSWRFARSNQPSPLKSPHAKPRPRPCRQSPSVRRWRGCEGGCPESTSHRAGSGGFRRRWTRIQRSGVEVHVVVDVDKLSAPTVALVTGGQLFGAVALEVLFSDVGHKAWGGAVLDPAGS